MFPAGAKKILRARRGACAGNSGGTRCQTSFGRPSENFCMWRSPCFCFGSCASAICLGTYFHSFCLPPSAGVFCAQCGVPRLLKIFAVFKEKIAKRAAFEKAREAGIAESGNCEMPKFQKAGFLERELEFGECARGEIRPNPLRPTRRLEACQPAAFTFCLCDDHAELRMNAIPNEPVSISGTSLTVAISIIVASAPIAQ